MKEIQLGVIESRYADMIWKHEPVTSSELVKIPLTVLFRRLSRRLPKTIP